MGEIERIQPVRQMVPAVDPANRIVTGSHPRRHRREADQDPVPEPEEQLLDSAPEPDEEGHRLDLSI